MSKKTKGKNAFTSLSINRVAQEEIQKYNNNAIHLTYSQTENNNLKNNRFPKRPNQTKYSNGSSEINIIRNTTYQTNNKNNSPNKKDKNNYIENPNYNIQPIKKNKSGIVINIYSRKNDNDKEDIIVNEDNYCYDNDNDNQTEKDEYENLRNNKNNFNELDRAGRIPHSAAFFGLLAIWIPNVQIVDSLNAQLVFTGAQRVGDIRRERQIAVFVPRGLDAVDGHNGLAHHGAEMQQDAHPPPVLRHQKSPPIPQRFSDLRLLPHAGQQAFRAVRHTNLLHGVSERQLPRSVQAKPAFASHLRSRIDVPQNFGNRCGFGGKKCLHGAALLLLQSMRSVYHIPNEDAIHPP